MNFISCLTPPGSAALATLALVGPEAWSCVRSLFRTATNIPLPDEPGVDRFWLGKLGDPGDEVVLATRARHVEIHCHGGVQVVDYLLELFVTGGMQVCSSAEFQRHLGVARWRIDAELALTQAPTQRTAHILLDQYHGALQRALANIATLLDGGDVAGAKQEVDALVDRVPLGRHLLEPWQVVLAGPVNVGKSSLVNALTGYTRSLVSPQPGTTRDVVRTRLALDGWPVDLADTAGQRTGGEDLEQAGIALAQTASAQADLVLWVVDVTEPLRLAENLSQSTLVVVNKTDLPAAWDVDTLPDAQRVSAQTLAGIDALAQRIADRLVPSPPPAGSAVPFKDCHFDHLEKLARLLETGDVRMTRDLLQSLAPMLDQVCG